MIFSATIRDGSIKPDSPVLYHNHLDRLEGKRVRVSVTLPKRPRGGAENRYYWGVVLAMIAEETGHTPEEIHDSEPIQKLRRTLDDTLGWITRSTTTFTTTEFEDYLTHVRIWAATYLGLNIPLPNERE